MSQREGAVQPGSADAAVDVGDERKIPLSAEVAPHRRTGGEGRGGTERQPWQEELRRFVLDWRRKNPPSREERRAPMARPYLSITRTAGTDEALRDVGKKEVPVIVENLGNVASYTCTVRALEARRREPIHEMIPLAEFTLGGQLTFTLQPGETREVRVPFTRTDKGGTFIALVSDPILDPNELSVADWNHRRILLVNLV